MDYPPSFDEEAPDQGYMLKVEGVEIPKSNGKFKGESGEEQLREAKEKAQGDVFAALDTLVKGVETSLEVAGKISGGREEEEGREEGRTVQDVGGEGRITVEDKGKGRAETCDY